MRQPYKVCQALAAVLICWGGGSAHAQPETAQLIELAASLNEMALACGDVTASELKNLQVQQRAQLLAQGMSASAYDQAYAQSREKFLRQWKAGTPAQQKQSCQHMQRGQAAVKAAKP
jgi:hypothetical protein